MIIDARNVALKPFLIDFASSTSMCTKMYEILSRKCTLRTSEAWFTAVPSEKLLIISTSNFTL